MQSWSTFATLLGTAAALKAGVQNHDRGVELAVADSLSPGLRGGVFRADVDAAGGVLVIAESYDSYDAHDSYDSYDHAGAYDYADDSGLGAADATPPSSEDSYDYADAYDYSYDSGLGAEDSYDYADAYDYLDDSGLGVSATPHKECTSGNNLAECPWDYNSFHIGNWPDVGFPKCQGLASEDHNEWQSPIDLPKSFDTDEVAETPEFTALYGGCKDFELVQNEHTFEAEFHSHHCTNLKVTWKNKTYTMIQFHFHSESENMVNLEHYPGEMHMVHAADDGSVLVLGVFLEHESGKGNPFLTRMFDQGLRSNTTGSEDPVNPYQSVIANNAKFLSYLGSFTTPPCTANVEWLSILKPIPISSADLGTFKEYLKKDASQVNSYYQNFRPIQPLNDRKFKMGTMINKFEQIYSSSAMAVSGPGPLDE